MATRFFDWGIICIFPILSVLSVFIGVLICARHFFCLAVPLFAGVNVLFAAVDVVPLAHGVSVDDGAMLSPVLVIGAITRPMFVGIHTVAAVPLPNALQSLLKK